MGCCEFIMKAILVIINSIVILSGLALLVSGGIYLSKAHEYFEVAELDQYSSDIKPVAIPLMVIGGILLVVGLVGCCGAISGKNGLLNIYIIVVVITVVVEVAVCVYCVVKKDAILEASVEGGEYLVSNVNFGNATDNDITTINSIQYVLSCCGTTGKDSYTTSGFPKSCCNDYTYNTEDGSASELNLVADCGADGKVYDQGCTDAFTQNFNNIGLVIGILIGIIIVFELFCVIAACVSKKHDMVA